MIDFRNYSTIILVLISLIFKVNSQLKIPLTYFPKYKYNTSSVDNIMNNIIFQRIYANIEIGTPKKTIQIPLLFDANEFFIGDNPANHFDKDYFKDLKFYDVEKSETCQKEEDGDEGFCGVYFMYSTHMNDWIYFGDRKEKFSFYVPYEYYEAVSGGIGMKLNADNQICEKTLLRNRTFFEQVKEKKLINKYDFSIFYESKEYKKEEGAFLLMGDLPHEFNEDLGYYKKGNFDEKNIRNINMLNHVTKFEIDKIIGFYGKNQNNIIEDFTSNFKSFKIIELDYDNGGIQAPIYIKKFYEKAFEGYLGNLCFNETFTGFHKNFIYCKKEIGEDINKIKEKFPGVIFQSNDLNSNFTIDVDDLFLENGDYIFCLIYFYKSADSWKMGKPFLKKYQFSLNFDAKNIFYYQKLEQNKETQQSKGIPIYVLIIAIVGTILIVGLIVFLVFKFKFGGKCLRRKRANELEDDDYAYTSKEEGKEQNEKNNEEQQNINIDENDKLGINSE